MTILEREILEIITHLDEEKQRRLLEIARELAEESQPQRNLTLEELARLPLAERNRAVQAALASSWDDDVEVLEAFDERDFDDD